MPQCRTHWAALLPPGCLGAPPVIQDQRMYRALEAPETFEGPLRQNAWAHTSTLISAAPPLAAHLVDWACRPPGG